MCVSSQVRDQIYNHNDNDNITSWNSSPLPSIDINTTFQTNKRPPFSSSLSPPLKNGIIIIIIIIIIEAGGHLARP